MEISWLQAILIGICACLSSMPGMGGSSIGNYTLGRPLIGGLVCGIILGDMTTGILVGCAMQDLHSPGYSGRNSICGRACSQLHRYPAGYGGS